MVRARCHQTCLQHTQSLVALLGVMLDGKHGAIRTCPQASLRLFRLPVQLERGQGQTNPIALADLKCKNSETFLLTHLSGLAADVPDRKAPPRSTPYKADTVAFEKK